MQQWYHAKAKMEAAMGGATSSSCVFLGKDAGRGKAFAYFPSFGEMERYVDGATTAMASVGGPSLYEVIYDKTASRVYVFFDLDRNVDPVRDEDIMADLDAYRARFVSTFIAAFQDFLRVECGTDVALVPGINCQVACSFHATRLSFHTKVDIPCDSPLKVLEISQSFQRFCLLTLPLDEQAMFAFDHFDDVKQKTVVRWVFDESVYSHFRHFRLLYSCKDKKGPGAVRVPKLPFAGSSPLLRDHVVQQHAEVVSRAPITLAREPAHVLAAAAVPALAMHTTITRAARVSSKLEAEEQRIESSRRSGAASVIPPGRLAAVRDTLLSLECLRQQLRLRDGVRMAFKHSNGRSPTEHSFGVDPACGATCPYAGRRHAHNRLTLVYYHKYNKVLLHCFHPACQRAHKVTYEVGPDPMLRLALRAEQGALNSLHCRVDVIAWDQQYELERSMRPYPLAPIVCVRSNMGTGKTVTLIDLIREQCGGASTSPLKCLMVTYQVLLSRKYWKALEDLGFVNYLDIKGPGRQEIRDSKVVVCLDSLWRVKTSNFDFVFIDEALSVLLHFNSSLMKRVSDISMVFELLLLQARHIYLLDAAVDNAVVHEFVLYLERIKKVSAVWVRNTYRAETNRAATLLVNTSRKPGNRGALLAAAVRHAVEALAAGRRIVVSSTTKRFTDILGRELARQAPGKRVMVYNSGSDRHTLQEHAMAPETAWMDVDALIYSPTIGSGISFERAHFDELLAWVENSLDGATVDLSIQQFYRVRQLSSGVMTLFVQDTSSRAARESGMYPVLDDAVEDWLDASVNTTTSYLSADLAGQSKALSHSGRTIVYDRHRLSFHVLKGIVYIKHKSLVHFRAILVHTLQADYGIACDVREFQPGSDGLEAASKLAKRIAAYDQETVIPFSPDLILTLQQNDELQERDERLREGAECTRLEPLTPREKLQLWIHSVCTDLYGIAPSRCDEAFFDEYVGQATRVAMAKANETFYRMLRFSELTTSTSAEAVERYCAKLAAIVDSEDRNMELYRTRVRDFHEQVIAGSRLLEDLFGVDVHKVLGKRGDLVLSPAQLLEGFRRWTAHTTQEQYVDVVRRLGRSNVTAYARSSIIDAEGGKQRMAFLRAVMDCFFGIQVKDFQDNVNNPTHALYGFKMLSTQDVFDMVDTYEPTAFAMQPANPTPPPLSTYMFEAEVE